MRGEYGDFILIADHGNFFQENVVFSNLNDITHSYYVAEPALLDFTTAENLPSSFLLYDHKIVLGNYP